MKIPACASSADPLLRISASTWALACHALATFLAALSVSLSAVPLLWSVTGLVVIALVSWCGYRALKRQRGLCFQLLGGEVFLLVDRAHPSRIPVEVRRSWHLASWLLQLQYRPQGQRRWQTVLIWPDSASAETRRLLRAHEAFGGSLSLKSETSD